MSSHLLIFLSASQMQVECGQRVGMEGRRLSSGTCIHCHVRYRQSVNECNQLIIGPSYPKKVVRVVFKQWSELSLKSG